MKKNKCRWLALILALAMVCTGLLTSCGGNGDNGNGKNPTAAPSGDNEDDPQTEFGKVKIDIVDDSNAEKVITDKKFDTPKEFKAGNSVFKMSAIFSSGMVLQANMNDRIFGWYTGESQYLGAELKNEETGKTRTFYGEVKEGEFEIWLGCTNYGGPYSLTIFDADGASISYSNILFGEVYVLGGQSNMGWALGQCYDGTTSKNLYEDIIKSVNNDNVRCMGVWPVSSEDYVEYLSSVRGWGPATPENVTGWSACGFFFAMRLNELTNVPVGIIGSCMGGTSIDKWYTEESSGIWYRGMTHPVRKLTVRGVCWYQGEGDYTKYAERLTKLIDQWRVAFENPNLYWAAVEMPRYQNADAYFKCREQVKSLYGVVDKYTYCVTVDTGLYPEYKAAGDDLNNDGIHPYDKQKVGERLADAAAHDFYKAEGTYTCPQVSAVAVTNEGKVLLTFDNVGEGLTITGLGYGFEIAGSNRKFLDAKAEVVATNQVLVSCDSVTAPWGVRYGYKNYRVADYPDVKSASDSACCYSLVNGEIGYPIEQFEYKKLGS